MSNGKGPKEPHVRLRWRVVSHEETPEEPSDEPGVSLRRRLAWTAVKVVVLGGLRGFNALVRVIGHDPLKRK